MSRVFYTGRRAAWSGRPTIRPSRAKRAEHGPGIYLTTSLQTARDYAKGGGVVLRVELAHVVRWLEGARVSEVAVRHFVDSTPRLRRRAAVHADLDRYLERSSRLDFPASVLVNLMVNNNAAVGEPGAALARWLTAHGVDASHVRQSSEEDWVVVFNPEVIARWERAPKDAPWDLPRVFDGLMDRLQRE